MSNPASNIVGKTKEKVGLSDHQKERNIRVAPLFKGLSSVIAK
jgi:hypothetical protein